MELEMMKSKFHNVKLVVFDLDGTLLNSQSQISEESKYAIDLLKEKGIRIAIASGRIFSMIKHFSETLGLKDFIISSNGAAIDDLSTNQPLQQLFTNPKDAKKVVEFCVKNHIECNILKRDACYFQPYSRRIDRFNLYNIHARQVHSDEIKIILYDDGIHDYSKIEKLLIYEMDETKTHQVLEFVHENTKLIHMSSGHGYTDISSPGVSKGHAVKKIAEYLNISLDHVCVFGDYDNDVSMFEIAGLAIATANGSPKALENADFITLSNDDEGIAYAIKKLLLS
ncbi:MAG: Cof-type HAD-IIB family hydrolase [Firmicutes bacterium]|nr:Cof-type HAD-IIB family hydrolase [Bacillota bacterium]